MFPIRDALIDDSGIGSGSAVYQFLDSTSSSSTEEVFLIIQSTSYNDNFLVVETDSC